MSSKDLALAAAGASSPLYVDDVFSAYLYTGNGSTKTITNGIDLAGKGGLVWNKWRSGALGSGDNMLWDTIRGANQKLLSNTTDANINQANGVSFNTDGFSMGANGNNNSGALFTSWTFRKAPKFFDVVTYTGDGGTNKSVSHNLNSVPGMIIVKSTSSGVMNWAVYHTSLGITNRLSLNANTASAGAAGCWGTSSPTSTAFFVGGAGGETNNSGSTYVAYVFANNAGGFGSSGNDNVISCGSFTTDASGASTAVNLGYEPQFVMIKRSSGGSGDSWQIIDNMRGLGVAGTTQQVLFPDTTGSESAWPIAGITSTGFATTNAGYVSASSTFVYVAIRRPMKTPTSGTQVFTTFSGAGGSTPTATGFPVDLAVTKEKGSTAYGAVWMNRLVSGDYWLQSSNSNVEAISIGACKFDNNTGVSLGTNWSETNTSIGGSTYADWFFKRAPGFFDVVCFKATGAGGFLAINHNLGVSPNLIIFKNRTTPSYFADWIVGASVVPNGFADTLALQTTAGLSVSSGDFGTVNSSSFSVYNPAGYSNSYVAYLFATLAGISKVGSYTGNGTSQTINCGFAAGARFILIKCTSTTGDWYVWDTVRGIIAANDPHLSLNTPVAEVTTDDSIDPDNTGFIVNQVAATNINVTSATYIYLAIA